jgi:hypothetical protein
MDQFQLADLFAKTRPGAALQCLIAMAVLRNPMGVMKLVEITGASKPSVQTGLAALSMHGYATKIGRFDAWQLTDKALQLPLPGLLGLNRSDLIGLREGKKFALAPCSSSSSLSTRGTSDQEGELQLLQTARAEKLPSRKPDTETLTIARDDLSPEAKTVAYTLVAAGVKREQAEAAVHTAMTEHGRSLAYIEHEILLCLLYADSPRASSIEAPGWWAKSKIQNDELAPSINCNPGHPKYGAEWRKWETRNQVDLDRLRELSRILRDGEAEEDGDEYMEL